MSVRSLFPRLLLLSRPPRGISRRGGLAKIWCPSRRDLCTFIECCVSLYESCPKHVLVILSMRPTLIRLKHFLRAGAPKVRVN